MRKHFAWLACTVFSIAFASSCARLDPSYDRISAIIHEGNIALQEKRFDDAIRIYDRGLAVRPGEPSLLCNKAQALMQRAVAKYNAAIKLTDQDAKRSSMDTAKADFSAAADTSEMGIAAIKKDPYAKLYLDWAPGGEEAAIFQMYAQSQQMAARYADNRRALAALHATDEYLAVETNQANREQLMASAGRMLLETGHSSEAMNEYKAILSENDDSAEGNLGVGLVLSQSGDARGFEQARPYFQKFVRLAPDGHPMKADIQQTLENSK